mmetsp:Transcript_6127/g.20125  ORF Transcript_6127/g.20125 Transcript_6127/m.20125 type:complete len:202 (+) Transcript_6127:1014-1619(+)
MDFDRSCSTRSNAFNSCCNASIFFFSTGMFSLCSSSTIFISSTEFFAIIARSCTACNNVARKKNSYFLPSSPLFKNCFAMSCVITTIGLSTSMAKWSVILANSSDLVPIVSPCAFLIFNEFAPTLAKTFSMIIVRPYVAGINASSPSFEITTVNLACCVPDLIIPFTLFVDDRPTDFAFAPSATVSAVNTADFPDPFSPTM